MKKILLLLLICFSGVSSTFATTWGSDGSQANVQALHDQAATVDGDTITIPQGTFTWTSTAIITKAITIQGQTTVTQGGTAPDQIIGASDDKSTINYTGTLQMFSLRGSGGQRITGLNMTGTSTNPFIQILATPRPS